MSGFHALETKNPQRDYPRGMLIAVVIIFVATVIPTLAITFVVPQKQISLIAGLMQAFQYFFTAIGVGWLTRPMAVLVFVGAVALVSTWMIGPARGFKGPNRDGLLSPIWHRENRHGVPARVLFIQAGFGSLFSVFFLLIPGVSGAYWMLSALTTMFLCITYFLIFWAVVRLRYTEPDAERPFRVPGGKAGLWIIAGVGAVAVAYAFILGFVPPSQISTVSPYIYPWIMAIGTAVFVVPAFIYYRLKQPSWATSGARSVEAHRGGLEKGGAPAEVSAPPTDAAEEALTRRRTHRPWLAIGLACAIVLGVGVGTVSAVFSSSSSKTVKTASSASAITFARIQDELTRQGLQVVKATVSVPSAARMAGMTASERLFLSLKGTNPASASAAVDRLYIERYASPTKAELAVLMLTDTALRINLPLARAGTWSRGSYVIELRGEGPDAVTANVAAAMKNLGFN